jgi:Flp pilus assembly protein TadG
VSLPVVVVLALFVVQVGLVVRDQLALESAARAGARAAAVSASPATAAGQAARAATRLHPVDVQTVTGLGLVSVTVRRTVPTDLPLVGLLVPDVTQSASAVMALEPP